VPPFRPDETLTLPHPAPVLGLAPGTVIDGKYRLVAPIGAGGMGEVWLAIYTTPLGRSCAVKFLADSAPAARDRFLSEAQIMGTLHHPNIVAVFDHGIDAPTGLAYLVMDEFLPTPADTLRLCQDLLHCPPPAPCPSPAPLSLSRLLDGGKTLPEETVLSVARQLLSAIEAAHALTPPVIHRDIKPSNILFAPDGRALLTDFGIAKRFPAPNAPSSIPSDPSPTLPGATPGTPAYAAPEQLAGRPLTPAADFYSFGVVLYRALTGGMPPPSAALPSDIAPHVSRAWQKLFASLLAPDPASRLVHPSAIRTLFDEIARSLRPRARRRFRLVLLAATLALLATIFTALFLRSGGGETGALDPAVGIEYTDSPLTGNEPFFVESGGYDWIDEGAALGLWRSDAFARPIQADRRALLEHLPPDSPVLPSDGPESPPPDN